MSTKDAADTKQAAQTDPGLGPARAVTNGAPSDTQVSPHVGEDTVETTADLTEDSTSEGDKLNRADVARMLANIRPTTADVLKQKTAETRGQNYARYEGVGEPAKAKRSDTLDVPLVVADDTQVDGYKLTPEKIRRLERHQSEREERLDTTAPGLRVEEPKQALARKMIVAALVLGALGFALWAFLRPTARTDDGPPITPATAFVTSQAPSSSVPTATSSSPIEPTSISSTPSIVASSLPATHGSSSPASTVHPRSTSSSASSHPIVAPSATTSHADDPDFNLLHPQNH